MKDKLDKIFGFTEFGIVQDRNIPKKSFYEQDVFNTTKKKLFTEDIEKLKIIAICDKNTINIELYVNNERDYREIFFIQVQLKDVSKQNKISEIIHQVIPNPVVIIFTHENDLLVSVAHKRLSKQEKGKIVVEKEYNSPWVNIKSGNQAIQKFIKQLYLKNLRFDNLYIFYSDLIKVIIFSNFIEIINNYFYNKTSDIQDLMELADKHKKLKEKIVFHTNQDSKLKNFGDKVANHQKLIDAKKNLKILKQTILKI